MIMYFRQFTSVLLLTALCALALPVAADGEKPVGDQPPTTVEQAYLGLSKGPLRSAQLTDLPADLVMRSGDIQIDLAQIAAETNAIEDPPQIREQLQNSAFFVLELLATPALLLKEARAAGMDTADQYDATVIDAYLKSLVEEVEVTAEEARAFFGANADMFGNATYEQVQADLIAYLRREKQEALVATHINSLSERIPVEVNAAWLQQIAPAALDTVVDRARRSGKPALVDFGAGGCSACDLMTPIREEIRADYGTQCDVLFVSVSEEPVLSARYGITSIPVQILFDKDGKEFFRHTGFIPKEQLVAKLSELGLR
jgi:thiol-disulfide isomerase/thioredoxin